MAGFDFSFPRLKQNLLKSFPPEVHEDEDGEEERYDGDRVAQYPDVDLPFGFRYAVVVQTAVVVGEVVPATVL